MKDKICLICKTAIDTDKEYCEFKQYKKKNQIRSKAYYHVSCFRDRMVNNINNKNAIKYALGTIMNIDKKIKEATGEKEKEENEEEMEKIII